MEKEAEVFQRVKLKQKVLPGYKIVRKGKEPVGDVLPHYSALHYDSEHYST